MEALTQYRLQRRTLLKGLGVIGLASLSPCFFTTGKANAETLRRIPLKLSDYKTYRSTCAMECLHCNLTAWVWQDRLVKIEASKDFNVKCCLRGLSPAAFNPAAVTYRRKGRRQIQTHHLG